MKKILLSVFSILCSSLIFAQPGTIDPTFNIGTGANNSVFYIKEMADGKILVSGAFSNMNGDTRKGIIRLNADGSIDPTFSIAGHGPTNGVLAVAQSANGKLMIGGFFQEYSFPANATVNRIMRLKADGTVDSTFNFGTSFGANNNVETITEISANRYLVGGLFTTINGTTRDFLAAIDSTGALDAGFNSGGTGPNSWVMTSLKLPDGSIILGGEFSQYNGIWRQKLCKINSNGQLDANFNNTGWSGGASGRIEAIAAQSDGKIIVGGPFTTYGSNNDSHGYIVRLNSNGSTIDASFNTGSGFNGRVESIVVQSDGKIVVGGEFTEYNGQTVNRIVRLNADGTLDNTFDTGTAFNSDVKAVAIDSEDRILAGGWFTSYNGTTGVNRITRLIGKPDCDDTFASVSPTICQGQIYVAPDESEYEIGGTYEVTIPNAAGCDSIITINLTVNQPVPTTNISLDEVCGVFISGSGTEYTSVGTFEEYLTAANGCDSVVIVQISAFYQISETVTAAGDSLSSDMANATSFQWYDCATNNPIDGADSRVFYPTAPGNYKVIASVSECDVESECASFGDTGTSIGSLNESMLKIYPNPTKDVLNVKSEVAVSIEILDIRGSKLLSTSENLHHTINVSTLSAGMYLLKAGEQTFKFVKN